MAHVFDTAEAGNPGSVPRQQVEGTVLKVKGLGWVLPVTVYIRGPIKGYISPYYIYYPTVTEGGQYPRFGDQGLEFRGLRG